MNAKEKQSKSKRIKFYSEIGKYFKPNGNFDEGKFIESITSSLGEIKKKKRGRSAFIASGTQWLSEYLNEVLSYLSEKNMISAAAKLFRTTLVETKKMGLSALVVSTEHLEKIVSFNETQGKAEKIVRTDHARDAKRRKIFKAAISVFERNGYHKTTMDAIADAAGIGKASVYRMFKNKEMLLDEILQEKYNEIVEIFNKIHSKENDVLEQIKEMILFWLSFISNNYTVYQLILTETNPAGVNNRIVFYDYIASNLPMFKERIVALNRERKLKTLNFYSAFYGILGYIDGVVAKWLRSGKEYDLKDEATEILEVIFRGIVDDGAKKGR